MKTMDERIREHLEQFPTNGESMATYGVVRDWLRRVLETERIRIRGDLVGMKSREEIEARIAKLRQLQKQIAANLQPTAEGWAQEIERQISELRWTLGEMDEDAVGTLLEKL